MGMPRGLHGTTRRTCLLLGGLILLGSCLPHGSAVLAPGGRIEVHRGEELRLLGFEHEWGLAVSAGELTILEGNVLRHGPFFLACVPEVTLDQRFVVGRRYSPSCSGTPGC